jgi:hypothetical protein
LYHGPPSSNGGGRQFSYICSFHPLGTLLITHQAATKEDVCKQPTSAPGLHPSFPNTPSLPRLTAVLALVELPNYLAHSNLNPPSPLLESPKQSVAPPLFSKLATNHVSLVLHHFLLRPWQVPPCLAAVFRKERAKLLLLWVDVGTR